jgi:hypothetical protein
MRWFRSWRADPVARQIANRHYNRQKPDSKQFVPPGSCLVLLEESRRALWVTSAPMAEYVQHAWAGAWVCSCYRNEGAPKGIELIVQAVQATRAEYPLIPPHGMVSFIDTTMVKPVKVRGESVWGWAWHRAGFREVGKTKGGLLALQMLPADMPDALPAMEWQGRLALV